jgi:hypothetical protein
MTGVTTTGAMVVGSRVMVTVVDDGWPMWVENARRLS